MRLHHAGNWNVPYAVAVAVGPQQREVERCADLIESLACYEAGPAHVVLVDDSPEPRHLDQVLARPGFTIVGLHHPRHGKIIQYRKGKGICSAVLLALQWIQANTPAKFVVKIDTDSLIIGPFRQRLSDLFLGQPTLAMAGAFDRTPGGTKRDVELHARNVRKLLNPPVSWRHPIRSIRARNAPPLSVIRQHIRLARANGYCFGEHCLGGGYALSRRFLDEMHGHGFLNDPTLWLPIDLPEDVMVGIYVRACGMTFANHVSHGDVFGVRHIGLPETPELLVRHGYGVVHSVKNDPRFSEEEVREFFRAHRQKNLNDPIKLHTA